MKYKFQRGQFKKNIKELVDKGIVKRFGSSRNGYWEIL